MGIGADWHGKNQFRRSIMVQIYKGKGIRFNRIVYIRSCHFLEMSNIEGFPIRSVNKWRILLQDSAVCLNCCCVGVWPHGQDRLDRMLFRLCRRFRWIYRWRSIRLYDWLCLFKRIGFYNFFLL